MSAAANDAFSLTLRIDAMLVLCVPQTRSFVEGGVMCEARSFARQGKQYSKMRDLSDKSRIFDGALKGTRTPDLLVRSQSLYPTELSAHSHIA